ncbi:hypothetical protein [Haploplasma axanthum]|nr:hypothetical protein [Haploplasma axanthum]
MKKYVLISSVFVCFILLIVLIVTNKKSIDKKFITVDTLYSFLYNENQKIEIEIYINDDEFPLLEKNIYNDFKLHDEKYKKNLSLELVDVTYSHSEMLNNEYFHKYIFKFKMPNLTSDYSIEEAILDISFMNNNKISLKIGDLSLMYIESESEIKWISIDSKKNDPSDLQISQIRIELEQIITNIDTISIYPESNLKYSYIGNTLIIDLLKYDLVCNYIPIIIKTKDKQIYTISNHRFLIEYNILENAGKRLNIYDFN